MVPKKGLEPPHPCEYVDLNHARLPIPPLRHGTQVQRDSAEPAAVLSLANAGGCVKWVQPGVVSQFEIFNKVTQWDLPLRRETAVRSPRRRHSSSVLPARGTSDPRSALPFPTRFLGDSVCVRLNLCIRIGSFSSLRAEHRMCTHDPLHRSHKRENAHPERVGDNEGC